MTWDDTDDAPSRPLWLMTLADLALLLVGFFVFLQANQSMRPQDVAAAFRAGFSSTPEAMPVELATVHGFAPGSATPLSYTAAIAWAREAARDPRTRLLVTGEIDGTAADVDPATGSGAILAADRARAVAALLVRSGAVAPERIAIATKPAISTTPGQRRAVLTAGYDGGSVGGRQ